MLHTEGQHSDNPSRNMPATPPALTRHGGSQSSHSVGDSVDDGVHVSDLEGRAPHLPPCARRAASRARRKHEPKSQRTVCGPPLPSPLPLLARASVLLLQVVRFCRVCQSDSHLASVLAASLSEKMVHATSDASRAPPPPCPPRSARHQERVTPRSPAPRLPRPCDRRPRARPAPV